MIAVEKLERLREMGGSGACAHFILLHLQQRHGSQWLSGPRRPPSPQTGTSPWLDDWELRLTARALGRLGATSSAIELFQRFFLRGVVLDSHEGLVGWAEGRYPLVLRHDIPTPQEMLDLQCDGQRFVTLMLEPDEQWRTYGRHVDACAFLLHDFEHAHKFFSQPGQVKFFCRLRASLPLLARWRGDERFAHELDYLKADMNSHPVHLTKYLKAIVLTAEMRATGRRDPELNGFWTTLFTLWGMTGKILPAALNLNQPARESQIDQVLVRDFFMEADHVSQNRNSISDLSIPRSIAARDDTESRIRA